jgi:hypothetical protein
MDLRHSPGQLSSTSRGLVIEVPIVVAALEPQLGAVGWCGYQAHSQQQHSGY